MRLVIPMMIIPLVILIIFYRSLLNGFDQSVQFIYFIIIVIISIAVYGIFSIKDKWRDYESYIGIIGIILVVSIGFGFLSAEELNKVDVAIINPDAGSSVNAQFEISGLFKNIPENKSIWLYAVYPTTQKYYPEPIPVTKLNNGNSSEGSWSYYGMVAMKRFRDDGKHFQIGIFLSDKKDKNYIEQEIKRVNGSTRGMKQLPDRIEDLGIKININKM